MDLGSRMKIRQLAVSAGAINLQRTAPDDNRGWGRLRMIDLSVVLEKAARDPLVVAFGLMVLGGLTTHFLFKKYPFARAIIRVIFLILLTIVLVSADIVPYRPLQFTGNPFLDAVHGALKVAWWLFAAWFLVGFLRAFVIVEHRPREGKLLQDLLAGLIYLVAVFAIIAFVFDLPIQGLLATSGAAAIILGLALQSTLGDVFSGIVLSFSRPYRPGDWISLEGGTDGRVIEMNWRATHVLTGRRDLAIVPNSTIAKSKIVNVSSPSGIHGVTVTVQLDARTPPATGTEILQRAILNCRPIVATPAPSVTVKSINATCTEFEITFFVEDLASSMKAQNQLFDLIFRHLAVAGIDLATAPGQPERADGDQADRKSTTGPERLMELVAIFASLASDDRKAIAAKLKPKSYDEGETLVRTGNGAALAVYHRRRRPVVHPGGKRRRDRDTPDRAGRPFWRDRDADGHSVVRHSPGADSLHGLRAGKRRPLADLGGTTGSLSRAMPRTSAAPGCGSTGGVRTSLPKWCRRTV